MFSPTRELCGKIFLFCNWIVLKNSEPNIFRKCPSRAIVITRQQLVDLRHEDLMSKIGHERVFTRKAFIQLTLCKVNIF